MFELHSGVWTDANWRLICTQNYVLYTKGAILKNRSSLKEDGKNKRNILWTIV